MLWGSTKKEKQKSAIIAEMLDRISLVGIDEYAGIIAESQKIGLEAAKRVLDGIAKEAKEKGIAADDYICYRLETNDPSPCPTVTMNCPGCGQEKRVSPDTMIFHCKNCGLEKSFRLHLVRI